MFFKKTVKDINPAGKTVLVRVDYNVPLKDGKITDTYRITQSLPTLNYLLDKGAKLVLISHLGRPDGKPDPKYSLKPVVKELSKQLNRQVQFAPDCIGDAVADQIKSLRPGDVLLCENLRFHAEEEQNDSVFAQALTKNCDLFVQDGFGVVHRAHASTDAVTKFLPSVAGLLLEREVDTITNVMHKPERPLMAIIGGAKIADKIELIRKFISLADIVAVGGAMANTFLLARNFKIGASLADENEVPLARDILRLAEEEAKKRRFVLVLPRDAVVATDIQTQTKTRIVDWDTQVVADIENYPKRVPAQASSVEKHEKILDIGPFSGSFIAGAVQLSNTVVWNGTMGVTEVASLQGPVGPFAHGSELVIESLLGEFGHRPFSLVGGGDTVGYVQERGLTTKFNHVSTGGGASLELMAGKKLPGVEALENKE